MLPTFFGEASNTSNLKREMEGVTLQMDFLEIDENKTGFYCKGSYTYSITGTSKKLFRS